MEIDGGVHRLDQVILRDHLRQVELEGMGWTIVRFTDAEVMDHPERLARAIRSHAAGLGI